MVWSYIFHVIVLAFVCLIKYEYEYIVGFTQYKHIIVFFM